MAGFDRDRRSELLDWLLDSTHEGDTESPSFSAGKLSLTDLWPFARTRTPPPARIPGKVSRSDRLAPLPVQRRATGDIDAEDDAAIAEAGLSGAVAPLPHLETIQDAFGEHDVSGVTAARGRDAALASESIGAAAYTSGDRVALPGSVDLFTAAHEAAHVIQQRAGAVSGEGVAAETEELERHADRVAESVVAGRSAAPLLDEVAGRGAAAPGAAVQRQRGRPDGRPVPLAGRPEDCPTYEMWIASFRHLDEFRAREGRTARDGPESRRGFRVIGERADRDPLRRGDASPDDAEMARGRSAYGDRFIDHPQWRWLEQNMAPELVRCAYQLPADCADISFVLRHVWLTAHHRSEVQVLNGRRFVLGIGAGRTPEQRQASIGRSIRGGRQSSGVSSANMIDMVQAYAGRDGTALRSRQALLARLHPGDLLIWEHRSGTPDQPGRATGGHVQTVQSIARGGGITVTTLQGNQPIFADDVDAIEGHLDEAAQDEDEDPARRRQARRQRSRVHGDRNERRMRNTPGRRIERSSVPSGDLPGHAIWGRIDRPGEAFTWLLAAGPPRSAERPEAGGAGGRRQVSDWTSELEGASDPTQLQARLEAALGEARSYIEGGESVPAASMRGLGAAAARRGAEIGAPLDELRQIIFAFTGRTEGGRRLRAFASRTDDRRTHHDTNPRNAAVFESFRVAVAGFDAARRESAPRRAPAQRRTIQRKAVQRQEDPAAAGLERWPERLRAAAALDQLRQTFSEALGAVRAASPEAVSDALATEIGTAAGQKLWELARQEAQQHAAQGRAEHFDPLQAMLAEARRGQAPALARVADALNLAGRGASDLSQRGDSGDYHLMITGFDPFTGRNQQPAAGAWNPSGAAAMYFDNQQRQVGQRTVQIQSAVFPVSFDEFDQGIVERVIGEHGSDFDAVITISMGMSTPGSANRAIEIERYAVGVHDVTGHRSVPIPAGPDGRQASPVIESNAPVDEIGAGAGVAVDSAIELELSSATADAVMAAVPAALRSQFSRRNDNVTVSAPGALDPIERVGPNRVRFSVGGQRFEGAIRRGPGGNFLSNEIAYRTQRQLGVDRDPDGAPQSFHVHTLTDHQPGMQAPEIRAAVIEGIEQLIASLVIVNGEDGR